MGLSIDLGAGNNLPVPPLQPASALGAAPQSKAQSSSEQSIADSIGSVSTGGTQDGVSVTYDAVDWELDFVNTDKGSDAVNAHLIALDPHGDRAYTDSELADHTTDPDPHGDRAYTDAELIDHVSAPNPHPQYVDQAGDVMTGGLSLTGATGKLGHGAGAGGSVTQLTSRSTAVTLDRPCGRIITHNAALAAGEVVTFTLNNTTIGANDLVMLCLSVTGLAGQTAWVSAVSSGSCDISILNGPNPGVAVSQLTFVVLSAAVL